MQQEQVDKGWHRLGQAGRGWQAEEGQAADAGKDKNKQAGFGTIRGRSNQAGLEGRR
jgi:hypothetical protein